MEVLTSSWLRRIGQVMRTRNQALYARLNAVRKRLIAGRTQLDAYQALSLKRFQETCLRNARSSRILELGSDDRAVVLRELLRLGAYQVVGINNSIQWGPRAFDGVSATKRDQLINADARCLPFAESTFDFIFSVATFEHILDLPRALQEMHRVLRPGGLIYANFGPIWSGGKGHHVYARVGDEEARHFKPESNPLPDFCHLLMDPEQARAALHGRTSDRLVEPIISWLFDSDKINRLFFHEYIKAFHQSRLDLLSVRTEDDSVGVQLRRILQFRYPQETRFEVTNMEVILCKPDNDLR